MDINVSLGLILMSRLRKQLKANTLHSHGHPQTQDCGATAVTNSSLCTSVD